MAPQWMSSIDAACRRSSLIVLGGDIFDFRWAKVGGHEATLAASQDWLSGLLERNPHARIIYILGNHDSHPDLKSLLTELSGSSCGRLEWYSESFRLADCLFCHGDILDAGSQLGLSTYRRKFHHERPASRAAHGAYEMAVAMRLHRTIPQLFHRPRTTCRKLVELLGVYTQPELSRVRRVFFGHTHVPIYELPLGQLHFYNPGAALRHLSFAPIHFEVSDA